MNGIMIPYYVKEQQKHATIGVVEKIDLPKHNYRMKQFLTQKQLEKLEDLPNTEYFMSVKRFIKNAGNIKFINLSKKQKAWFLKIRKQLQNRRCI